MGQLAIGVRSSRVEVDAAIRAAFSSYVVEGVDAPPNYSVRIGVPDGDTHAGRALHVLYRSSIMIARSRRPSRILRALVAYLSSHLDTTSDLVTTSALAMVADGRAILAPRWLVNNLDVIQPRLERQGVMLVDTPFVDIDPATAELVVPSSPLEVDEQALAGLDQVFPPPGREAPPVGPGRYPLQGWAFVGSPEKTGPVSRATGVGEAMATVRITEGLSEAHRTLEALGSVLRVARPVAVWYTRAVEVVPQLVALAKE